MTECKKAFEEWLKGEGKFESSIPDEAKRAGYIACWKNHVEPLHTPMLAMKEMIIKYQNTQRKLEEQNKLLKECVEWYSKLGRGELAKACLKKVGGE